MSLGPVSVKRKCYLRARGWGNSKSCFPSQKGLFLQRKP